MTSIMRQDVTEKPEEVNTFSPVSPHNEQDANLPLRRWFISSTFGFYSLHVSGLLLIQKVSKQNLYRLIFPLFQLFTDDVTY